ncbi:hypothetical protein M9458_053472 [Cirrhinus mrigala]|uniref:Uncharacterized protein n=1 Tax=Cirrhinus mrigala TaxID=683832 RepID=A0ABD0MRS1_CIRMR
MRSGALETGNGLGWVELRSTDRLHGAVTSPPLFQPALAPAPRLSYEKVDFSLAEAINQEFLATRSNEKRELQELNDRFASFIEKLVLELGQYKDQQQGPSGRINELCQQEMRELRRQLELMGKDRDQMQVERDNLAEDVALLKQRCVC